MLKMCIAVSSTPGTAVHCVDFLQSLLNSMSVHDFVCECVKGRSQSDRRKKAKNELTETKVLTC